MHGMNIEYEEFYSFIEIVLLIKTKIRRLQSRLQGTLTYLNHFVALDNVCDITCCPSVK